MSSRLTRTGWLTLIAAVRALILGGRMALRYLDWRASDAARQRATVEVG